MKQEVHEKHKINFDYNETNQNNNNQYQRRPKIRSKYKIRTHKDRTDPVSEGATVRGFF